MENETRQRPHIMELIANAPWREAVTYRDSWPHEYVVIRKDGRRSCWRRSASGSSGARASSAGSSTRCAVSVPRRLQVLDHGGLQ